MRYCDVLGLHVNYFSAEAKASVLALLPGILKILNTAVDVPTLQTWRKARPDGELIFRDVQDSLAGSVQQRCDALLQHVAPLAQYVDIVELPWNESYQDTQGLATYASLSRQATDYLRGRGWNRGIAYGNFSVDQPADMPALASYLDAQDTTASAFFSCHEYDAATMASHGYCGRFALLPLGSRQKRVTECGIDGGVLAPIRKGWRSYASAAAYASMLQRYARVLWRNGAKGVCYCCGQFGDWLDYDIAGEQTILAALGEVFPMPNVGQGFQKCVPFIGQFLEDQVYDFSGTPQEVATAVAQFGYATWCPATNETFAHVMSGPNVGEVLADFGNRGDGSGRMIQIRPPYPKA